MADFGISGTVMDFHNFDDASFETFGAEYFRITQSLLQAGIDIHMLSPMDRSRISAALWADNTLFEEGGALIAMYRQSYGLLDAMHVTETEKAKMLGHIDEAETRLEHLEANWPNLTAEQKAILQRDWDARSKNMATHFFELDELRLNGASPQEVTNAQSVFSNAMPLVLGGASAQYYMERQHLIDQSRQERHVFDSLGLDLNQIQTNFVSRVESIKAPPIETSFTGKPAGFNSWADKITAERNVPTIVEEKPIKNYNPEDWQGYVTAKREKEAQLTEDVPG